MLGLNLGTITHQVHSITTIQAETFFTMHPGVEEVLEVFTLMLLVQVLYMVKALPSIVSVSYQLKNLTERQNFQKPQTTHLPKIIIPFVPSLNRPKTQAERGL